MKKIFAGLAAAGLVASSFGLFSSSAQAACNNTQQNKPSANSENVISAPNGTTIYKSQGLGGTSGWVGVKGGTGFIEGNGSAANGGHLRGSTNDGTANGRVEGNTGGARVCMNDVDVRV